MSRQIQVTLPNAKSEEVFTFLSNREHCFCLNDFAGRKNTLIMFKIAPKRVSDLLTELSNLGVGVEFGFIDIMAVQSSVPRLDAYYDTNKSSNPLKQKRKYKLSDRMTVEEIYEVVDGQAHLTFDYIANICVAGLIAAVGLMTDSPVTVVASMLVSPLMGPIIGITFGAVIRDVPMVKRALYNEIVGILICIFVGMLVGIVVAPFYGPGGIRQEFIESWRETNNEMSSRGNPWSLLAGAFVAMPSGMGVALGLTGGGINALVGVAISAALLPPLVNSGLCMSFGIWYITHENEAPGTAWMYMSMYSFCLFMMNFVLIFAFATITFKIKDIGVGALIDTRGRKMTKTFGELEAVLQDEEPPNQPALASDNEMEEIRSE